MGLAKLVKESQSLIKASEIHGEMEKRGRTLLAKSLMNKSLMNKSLMNKSLIKKRG